MKLLKRKITVFQKIVWDYYRKHKRQFPWRETNDPYRVLVSEVMLQQTQAERVVPFFKRFVSTFPTIEVLAHAPLRKILRAWSGLGYNRRALYLKRAAEAIVFEHGGAVPRDLEKLDILPGIGRDTASAVLAFAFGGRVAFIETNIRTVYLHFFFKNRKRVRDEEILKLVAQTLPTKVQPTRSDLFSDSRLRTVSGGRARSDLKKVEPRSVREWYDALMDYGTMLKETRGNPNVRSAHYTKQKRFAGSRRELRGSIMRFLTHKEPASFGEIKRAVHPANHNLTLILKELVREGFLQGKRRRFRVV